MEISQRLSNNKGFGRIKITLMFFLLTLTIVAFCPEETLDRLYASGLYVLVRWLVDWLNNFLGIPFLYLVIPILICWAVYSSVLLAKKSVSLRSFFSEFCFRLIRALMIGILAIASCNLFDEKVLTFKR